MKKIITFFTTLLVSLTLQAAPEAYIEGVDYQVISTPHTQTPTVTEYFSFYCPHCFSFEPIIGQLKNHIDGKATFKKVSVSFMGGEMGKSVSKAYATMVELGVEEQIRPALFQRIHQQKQPPRSEQDLRQLFLDYGVSAQDFDNTYNSFSVDSTVRQYDKAFQETGVPGVPTVVVNGKYIPKTENIKTIDEYLALIDFLLKK